MKTEPDDDHSIEPKTASAGRVGWRTVFCRKPSRLLIMGLLASITAPPLQAQVLIPSAFSLDKRPEASASGDSTSSNILFQPVPVGSQADRTPSFQEALRAQPGILDEGGRTKTPPASGEFEDYVARTIGKRLPRFGQDLVLPSQRDFAAPSTASVPPDYRLNVGDAVVISLVGSLSGSVEREIDTNGNIFLPNVGAIRLAGVRFADVRDRISEAIGVEYRGYGFDVNVSTLRGVRVYVTGFANNPGAFTVSSLSTIANAMLQAGGPNAGGSFRSVKLHRDGREVADFDLYDLLRGGSRVNDAVLQNEDVLFIPPAGPQFAIIGSVRQEAIYEARPGETIEQSLAAAGGPNMLGDLERLILHRPGADGAAGPRELPRSEASGELVRGGDIIQVLSKGTLIQPTDRQSVLVRIEGEVVRPGHYHVPPDTSLEALLELAGGMTSRAFPYGAKFVRQKVREQQIEGYRQAISQLETTIASAPLIASSNVTASERAAQLAAARELLERIRAVEPDGRIVLDVTPDAVLLPAQIRLENNDHLMIPARPATIGVFGAVYRPSTFSIEGRRLSVGEYLEKAGGVQRAADKRNIFVVRANGEVLTRRKGALSAQIVPGDIIFVPVKTNSGQFWRKLEDISAMIFRLGITAAAVAALD